MNMSTPVPKVALYIRVSTEDQNTDMQLNELREYVTRRNWDIYQIYEDKISGGSKSRPELDKLMEGAKKRKFDMVLVWKFDRFARSLKMLVVLLELFKELGIDFISYRENIDTTTSMGRLIFHINSAYAEFERDIIRERVKSGVKAKRQKLSKIGDTSWGRKFLDQERQRMISEMLKSGISVRKVAKELKMSTRTVWKYGSQSKPEITDS
jgi:DNA invertase Pin-like site-specific DNA recombinase